MFEGALQNYWYKVVMDTNILFEFTIVEFTLMKLNDIITTMTIMGDLNNHQVEDKASYIIGYSHTKSFLNYYFSLLALTDF